MDSGEKAASTSASERALGKSRIKKGKRATLSPAAQPLIRCPECGSERLWKDGLRYSKAEGAKPIQRWLCRSCGYRFTQSNVEVHVFSKPGELLKPGADLAEEMVRFRQLSPEESMNGFSLFSGENVGSHGHKPQITVLGKRLNKPFHYSSDCRVCVSDVEAKNLAQVESRNQERAAGATGLNLADVKGKIIEYAWWLQKQGYKSAKNKVNMIKRLVDLGANLWDPESVKEVLAKQTKWKDSYKMLMTYAYEAFLKMHGLGWEKPRYRQESALPFIPTEEELDQLIAGVGKKVGTFLQGLKDTGADPGELARLRWIDINWDAGTVNIRPVKGHDPRILKVSEEFLRRVSTLPRKGEYVFNYESLKSGFADAKKRLARKLENPRLLAVSFTTFRHWKGTMEYHKTRDLLHVKKLLGHKKVETTMIYVNLEQAVFTSKNDEYYVAVAHNIEEACKLVEAGFEYVTGEYAEGGKIFRKRK